MGSSGQTMNDRLLAARHSLAGQGLAKAICKATTEELIGPKRKHLDYLVRCTEEPNVSIPTLANLLLERVQNPNWIVVFKSLVTLHHMMCYGNERFTQYLASSNTNFQLSNFLDRSGTQGYDMSPFVRRYAKYLAEKSVSYRTVAFDFCKVKRGKEGGTLRKMSTDKLLKTLPTLHEQVDALLEFEATAADLNNGVINAAFMLMFRDLIRLFACYNDGIINLLEKYFDMNKKNTRSAYDIYKKFLVQMDRVAEFLKVAEKYGIEKSDIPDLARAPSSLLDALEGHLANLEGRKPGGSAATTPTRAQGRVNISAAVNTLSATSSAFGSASAAGIDEKLEKKMLQEEEQAMMKYKEQHKGTNPFAAPPMPTAAAAEADNTPNILDLFGMPDGGAPAAQPSASDDLLLRQNPFASVLAQQPQAAAAAPAFNAFGGDNSTAMFGAMQQQPAQQQPITNSLYPALFNNQPVAMNNGVRSPLSPMFPVDAANGLQRNNNGQFAAFPQNNGSGMRPNVMNNSNNNATAVGASFFGDILQPQGGATSGPGAAPVDPKIVSGDLDASLANLTSNLNLSTVQSKASLNNRPKGPPMAAVAASQQQATPTF